MATRFPTLFRQKKQKTPRVITGRYGLKYFLEPGSALDAHIRDKGIFIDWIAHHGNEFLPANATIFDIGANAGLLTVVFSKHIAPQGNVFVYEPDLQNIRQLKMNLELNQCTNCVVREAAVQDKANVKTVNFHIRRALDGDGNENRGLSSLIALPLHEQESITVEATTIDEEVRKSNISKVDFVKIDVEGAETLVLNGGQKTFERDRPIVQYEYSTALDRLAKSENSAGAFHFFEKLGYRQYALLNEQVLELIHHFDPNRMDCNVLCFPDALPRNLTTYLATK